MRTDLHGAHIWAALALLALALPAAAQERPPFPPTRDVTVTYRVDSSQPGAPQSVVMRYSAALDRFRVEGGLPGAMLVDRRTHHATIVIEPMGVIMDAPPRAGVDQMFLLETRGRFARKGGDTIAGLRCTLWEVVGENAGGTACVTADGVVLRAAGHDRQGRTGRVEATAVQYGPLAEALFQPPANARKVDLPALAAGLAGAGGGPGLSGLLDRLHGRQP